MLAQRVATGKDLDRFVKRTDKADDGDGNGVEEEPESFLEVVGDSAVAERPDDHEDVRRGA